MDKGRTLIDSGVLTNDKSEKQLWMVWYLYFLTFVDNWYGKDMILLTLDGQLMMLCHLWYIDN